MSYVNPIVALIESAAKPALFGLIGRRIERHCAADLATYFEQLARKIEDAQLENLADQPLDQALHAADFRLTGLLRRDSVSLLTVLATHIQAAYLAGAKQEVSGKDKLVSEQRQQNKLTEADKQTNSTATFDAAGAIDQLGTTGMAAADYAAKRAAKLVTDINKTTRDSIKKIIEDTIKNKLGPGAAKKAIRELGDQFSAYRARMIASTEMNDAMAEAQLAKMKRIGLEYKQLILSDDACEICVENSDEDPLPVGDAYPSGDVRPPFHPNCRCAVTGARAPEEEA